MQLSNLMQLTKIGVPLKNIELQKVCTSCQNDLFFSARKGDIGRFLTGISMLDNTKI